MNIDAHVHPFFDDTSLFQSYPKRTEEDLLTYLDQNKMDMAVMLPIAPYDRNESVQDICRKHPDRLIGFCSIHPTFFRYGDPAPQTQLPPARKPPAQRPLPPRSRAAPRQGPAR